MSKSRQIQLRCDRCHEEFTATIYDSINVTINPELREKFLNGSLYAFICPHCGNIHSIEYPLLYNDMDHRFMVQCGPIETIYNFCNMNLGEDGEFGMFSKCFENITRTGATSFALAVEKIVALENGLNHKVITMYRLAETLSFNEKAKEMGSPLASESFFCYDDSNNLSVAFMVTNENGEMSVSQVPFDKELYEEVNEMFGLEAKEACDYLFDDLTAKMVLGEDEEEKRMLKLLKPVVALCRDNDGYSFFAKALSYNKDKYSIGDNVLAIDANSKPIKGTIIKLIKDQSAFSYPCNVSNIRWLTAIIKPSELLTSGDSNEEIDNKKLLEALMHSSNAYEDFPYDLFASSKGIIGMCYSFGGFLNKENEDGSWEQIPVSEAKEGDIINNVPSRRMVRCLKDGKALLSVYLDQKDVPELDNGEAVSKAVMNLDDIVRFVVSSPEHFDGICINPDKECIVYDNSELFGGYVPNRIMDNDERLLDAINGLSKEEESFIGEPTLKYMKEVYANHKTPKQIAEENNVDIQFVGKELTKGYSRLKTIIKTNY